MERSMARARGGWVSVLALGVAAALSVATAALATPSMTPEEVAAACIDDMNQIRMDAGLAMLVQVMSFYDGVGELAPGAPISQVFKLAAPASGRIDKIGFAAAAKIEKSWVKCIGRINRLNGDGSLLKDIAVAHDQDIASIEEMLILRQTDLSAIVGDYIEMQ
jgi:hypothetical protein